MRTFEYMRVGRIVGAAYAEAEFEMLRRMGRGAWELAAVIDDSGTWYFYFKRELAP